MAHFIRVFPTTRARLSSLELIFSLARVARAHVNGETHAIVFE